MCGVVGYLSRTGRQRIPAEQLAHMRDSMEHRGPDDCGLEVFDGGQAALAFRRLAILDLSMAGHQPMASPDRRYWIVFNGEIYNFRELRKELEAAGHVFRSRCDTEVILAAYAAWGRECVQRFNGMWGFAIWDSREKTLFCSRDRLGVKPFYYYDDGDLFIFASEIRAILASGRVPTRPNGHAMAEYLYSGLVDGFEEGFFEEIHRLPPAHFVEISPRGRRLARYWSLSAENSRPSVAPGDVERFFDLLEDSVRLRLNSDAPLGTCLSGGLDSSSLVALASPLVDRPMATFSSYFSASAEFDESPFFRLVADKYHTETYVTEPQSSQLLAQLPQIIWHLEEPARAMGIYPQWNVMQLAAPHVRVVLDGQGGDEVLAGYDPYCMVYLHELARRRDPLAMFRQWRAMGRAGHGHGAGELIGRSLKRLLGRFKHLPAFGGGAREARPSFDGAALPLDREFMHENLLPAARSPAVFQDLLNERLRRDVCRDSLPALLRYEDKLGMAFSIEARTPFLDYRLVEFLFSLPAEAKIHEGWTKWILRQAMEGILPAKIQWRRDKKGFPTPVQQWFAGSLAQPVFASLMDGQLAKQGILNRTALERCIQEHRSGKRNWDLHLWRWLTASLWYDMLPVLTDRRYGVPLPAKTPAAGGAPAPRGDDRTTVARPYSVGSGVGQADGRRPAIPAAGDDLADRVGFAVKSLDAWVRRRDWRGYDPYDLRGLEFCMTLGGSKWRAVRSLNARLQTLMLSFPRASVALLGLKPRHNAKALGLFLSAYCRLAAIDADPAWIQSARRCAEYLEAGIQPGYHGPCWGYPFHWQSLLVFPKNTPSAVVSTTVGKGFWDLYQRCGEEKYLDVCRGICDFLVNDLHVSRAGPGRICFSYTPLDQYRVHNANLATAAFLTLVGKHCSRPEWLELAGQAGQYALNDQNDDGSLYYWGSDWPNPNMQRDVYHSGFEIRAFWELWHATGDAAYQRAAARYLDFFRKAYLREDGAPVRNAFELERPLFDIHGCAEAILCLATVRRDFPNFDPDLGAVTRWTLNHMQNRDGSWAHQIAPGGRIDRTPYMRWGQAWMFRAMAEYLATRRPTEAQSPAPGSGPRA